MHGTGVNPSDQIFKNYYLNYKHFNQYTNHFKVAVPIYIIKHENDILKINNLNDKKILWYVNCTLKITFDAHQAMLDLFDVKSKKDLFSSKCIPDILRYKSHQVILNTYSNVNFRKILKDFTFVKELFGDKHIINTDETYATYYEKYFANKLKPNY